MKKVNSPIYSFKKLNTRSIVSRHIQDWPKGIYALWSSVGKEQLTFSRRNIKVALNFLKKKIQIIIINKNSSHLYSK